MNTRSRVSAYGSLSCVGSSWSSFKCRVMTLASLVVGKQCKLYCMSSPCLEEEVDVVAHRNRTSRRRRPKRKSNGVCLRCYSSVCISSSRCQQRNVTAAPFFVSPLNRQPHTRDRWPKKWTCAALGSITRDLGYRKITEHQWSDSTVNWYLVCPSERSFRV